MTTPEPSAPGHPLHPPLPYDMTPRIEHATRDVRLRQFVSATTTRKHRARATALDAAFGARLDAVRDLAARIKQHTLDHLDVYLEQFTDRAEAAGIRVHFARDASEANAIGVAIAAEAGARTCVKSKSMVTEETRLVPAFIAAGIETVETDLGEFIVQLDDDAPSHIVAPMIHKDRATVARVFRRELGVECTDDPAALTAIARDHLRRTYRRAELGVSGANFLVAERGTIVLCTNEGNADFCVSGPRVHVVFAGIEKLVPRLDDLSVFLKLLARSATAQDLTVYTTLVHGPRRPSEHDGPDAVHVVLLDNGRSDLLRPETRALLRCIRCGACLNACPVFRAVGGGHAYGAVYSGPIGAAVTPLRAGLPNYPDLPRASSLCGACGEVCPVRIDLPGHLVHLRRRMVDEGTTRRRERWLYRVWARLLARPRAYGLAAYTQRRWLRWRAGATRRGDGLDDHGWIEQARGPLAGWTSERDFPTPPSTSFHAWWRNRGSGDGR